MLRERLQQITEGEAIDRHAMLIDALRPQFAHTIVPITGAHDSLRYNCVMHALGIERDREYFNMITYCPEDVHASPDFLQFLIDRGELVPQQTAAPGRLVIYRDAERIRHVGVLANEGRVRSKWGIGHLYEHGPREIPASYGFDLVFFDPLPLDVVLDGFWDYATTKGVSFEPD